MINKQLTFCVIAVFMNTSSLTSPDSIFMCSFVCVEYRLVAKKGEGTFSEVLKAQCIKNGKYVAIKCMKNHFDSLDQVNNLREIQALRRLSPHSNIIKLLEVLYDQPTGRLALVFELMDMNIYELIRGRRHYVAEDRIKIYMYQLAKAMDHMHRNGIFHRDIKPENILIADDVLKLADFGSCRGTAIKYCYYPSINKSCWWNDTLNCKNRKNQVNEKKERWKSFLYYHSFSCLQPKPETNTMTIITIILQIIITIKNNAFRRRMNASLGLLDKLFETVRDWAWSYLNQYWLNNNRLVLTTTSMKASTPSSHTRNTSALAGTALLNVSSQMASTTIKWTCGALDVCSSRSAHSIHSFPEQMSWIRSKKYITLLEHHRMSFWVRWIIELLIALSIK